LHVDRERDDVSGVREDEHVLGGYDVLSGTAVAL